MFLIFLFLNLLDKLLVAIHQFVKVGDYAYIGGKSAIGQSLANIRQELLANYSDYISFDESGLAKVDFSYEDMYDSDIIKTDGLEKLIEKYNSTYDMALDKEQEYLNAQKEFDKLKSEARDKYIAMEQNVIDIIKKQMKEEIDAVTDKYAAF